MDFFVFSVTPSQLYNNLNSTHGKNKVFVLLSGKKISSFSYNTSKNRSG